MIKSFYNCKRVFMFENLKKRDIAALTVPAASLPAMHFGVSYLKNDRAEMWGEIRDEVALKYRDYIVEKYPDPYSKLPFINPSTHFQDYELRNFATFVRNNPDEVDFSDATMQTITDIKYNGIAQLAIENLGVPAAVLALIIGSVLVFGKKKEGAVN